MSTDQVIPKTIYQTWKTKKLPASIESIRNDMAELNPGYQMVLFDDAEMEEWIRENYPGEIWNAFRKLGVGAAKADMWRYLMLYKNGGVYLDMDSRIVRPIKNLIAKHDAAIISRESNERLFVQWCLIFHSGHRILELTIEKCVKNIEAMNTRNICQLTGPNVYSEAIYEVLGPNYRSGTKDLYFEHDWRLNSVFCKDDSSVRCRFYKVDYGKFCEFKHQHAEDLYGENAKHWRDDSDKLFV